MRSTLWISVLVLSGVFMHTPQVTAQPETAQQIIDQVAAQPTPEASAVKLNMNLISKRGDREYSQQRLVEMFAVQTPEGNRSMLRFQEPKDIAGVALLMRENKGKDNDQWLYMPALKQDPKRISGGQKNASFLGTDFTFADLEGRDPGLWTHTLRGEETLDGQATWVIESLPAEDTDSQYSKTVQWIRKDIYVPIKVEFFENDKLLKVLTVQKLDQIDGYWIAVNTRMQNVIKHSATELEILEQKNNLEFPEDFFTTRRLKNR